MGFKFFGSVMTLIVFLLIFCSLGFAAGIPADTGGHWAEKQISQWTDKGLVKGYDDGTFKPNNSISRAEFMTMVNRAFGFKEMAAINYVDVAAGAWYHGEIAKAVQAGYIKGDVDGLMNPNRQISRQEAAIILYRLLELDEDKDNRLVEVFNDAATIASWSKKEVNAIVKDGYLSGYPDRTFRPGNNMTRAETVTVLARAVGELYNEAGIYGPAANIMTIDGNVTVNTSGVILKNMIIKGDLLLTAGIGDGDAHFVNVIVEGRTVVTGGGEESIIFEDSTLAIVIMKKEDGKVRIALEGSSSAVSITIKAGGKVEITTQDGRVTEVDIETDNEIELSGNFDTVNIEQANTKVDFSSGTITNLNIGAGASGSTVTGEGSITRAFVSANVTIEKPPGETIIKLGVTANIGGQNVAGDKTTEQMEEAAKTEPTPPTPTPLPSSSRSGGAPALTPVTAISIDGRDIVGATLTVVASSPSNATLGNYQWKISDTEEGTYENIAGATLSTYKIATEDEGKYIKVTASGTGNFTGSATSDVLGPVREAPGLTGFDLNVGFGSIEIEVTDLIDGAGSVDFADLYAILDKDASTLKFYKEGGGVPEINLSFNQLAAAADINFNTSTGHIEVTGNIELHAEAFGTGGSFEDFEVFEHDRATIRLVRDGVFNESKTVAVPYLSFSNDDAGSNLKITVSGNEAYGAGLLAFLPEFGIAGDYTAINIKNATGANYVDAKAAAVSIGDFGDVASAAGEFKAWYVFVGDHTEGAENLTTLTSTLNPATDTFTISATRTEGATINAVITLYIMDGTIGTIQYEQVRLFGTEEGTFVATSAISGSGAATTVTSKSTHYNVTSHGSLLDAPNNTITANTTPITSATLVGQFLENLTKADLYQAWIVTTPENVPASASVFGTATAKDPATDTLVDGDVLTVLSSDWTTIRSYAITVTAAVDLSEFTVALAEAGDKTAGVSFNLAITGAKGQDGNNLTGSVIVVVTSNTVDGVRHGEAVTFTDGAATVPVTLSTLGAHTLTVDVAGITDDETVAVNVVAPDLSEFTVALAVAGDKAQGEAFDLSITGAKGADGNDLAGEINVTVTSNVDGAVHGATVTFTAGAATVPVTLSTLGAHTLTVDVAGITDDETVAVNVVAPD